MRVLLKLGRFDTSFLVALSVFVPMLGRTNDLGLSLSRAFPLLFIGMCTFISNDLDDVEKDSINHPERPLPSGRVTPALAASAYFGCLAFALFTIKNCIDPFSSFLYYALLVISISYGYVVECFPGFKSMYVASATTIPVLIVANFFPGEPDIYWVVAAVFLFVLSRELCMDLLDRTGDPSSFMHRVRPRSLVLVSFVLQLTGLAVLALQSHGWADFACLSFLALLLVLVGVNWLRIGNYKRAIVLMKVQLFAGLYFLV